MTDDPLRHALAETALAAEVRTWRRSHPNATLTEIERELDVRLAAARAALLAEVAADAPTNDARCPDCGGVMVRRGDRTRTLRTTGDAAVTVKRPYLSCPVCGTGVFPLDERLGLLPGSSLTPSLVEGLVRLGASVPFAQAAELLAHFTGVRVGSETVRRLTEAVGAVQVAIETRAVAEVERTLPDAPAGPAVQLLSVDGAMAPLVGGVWGEVKTLALGEVVATDDGVRTTALSYFSRLTDATTFGRLATGETQRRGTATAATVVAVTDGAVWCQGFVDWQRPDAVRILDFPHALEHLAAAAQAALGAGTPATSTWLGEQAHRLRHGDEETALAAVVALHDTPGVSAEASTVIRETHAYFATRREHIRYATFAAAGYPIGSGCVESANKLVVEARLKGAGMHWARGNVDPLLALRCLLVNGRWNQEWPALWRGLRAAQRQGTPHHTTVLPVPVPTPLPPALPLPAPNPSAPRCKLVINGKPTTDHPWKRGLAPRAKP